MRTVYILATILAGSALLFSGCDDGDDDSSSSSSLNDAVTDADAGNNAADDADAVAAGDAAAEAEADAAEVADEVPAVAFTEIMPTGLAQTAKTPIAGRGVILSVKCDAIEGASEYVFKITIDGKTAVSSTPKTSFQVTTEQSEDFYTLWVHALNAAGEKTQTVGQRVND